MLQNQSGQLRNWNYFREMILLTGSTGIVGSRLLFDLLAGGNQVRAMKRSSSDLEFVRKIFKFYDAEKGDALFNAIDWVDGDLMDVVSLESAMHGVAQVYNAAALVSYAGRDAEKLIELNVDGTANVVNCAIDAGIKKLCHISSVAALGKAKNGQPTNEATLWKRSANHSVYGLSKHLGEKEVWRGVAEGLPAVIVNPSIIIGPAKPNQSSGMLMDMLRKGIKYYPPGSAGYVDVRDVSRMSIALMDGPLENERYLLNSESIPYLDLLNSAAEVYNNPPPSIAVKPWMLEVAWRMAAMGATFTRTSPRITKETARSASQRVHYDSTKVQKALDTGFIPVHQSLAFFRSFYV